MSMTPETDLPEDGLGPDGFGLDGDAKLQLNGMSQPSQPGVFFGPGPPIQTTKVSGASSRGRGMQIRHTRARNDRLCC